ncbi:MAG: CotH kinase family protein [Clostridia bacterium]|nr:CotH kinase family protein [Clostridia bacterium]
MLSSKHISKITIILVSVVLILCILAMVFQDKLEGITNPNGYSMEYQGKLFDTSKIIDIDIKMDKEEWDKMLSDAMSETYYQCDVVVNGTTFYNVAIRPKGNTSLSSIANDPDNNRYSFKLEFDRFVEGQTCFGLDKLVLNNNYADATNMKEAIVYDMFRYIDGNASLYNYAKISVNSEYWGVYLALEAVEESFMLRNYGNEKGYLYKPDSMNFNRDEKDGQSFGNRGNGGGMPDFGGQMPDFANMEGQMPDFGNMEGKMPDFGGGGGGMFGRGGGANLNYIDDNTSSYSSIWQGMINESNESDHVRVVTALKNISNKTDVEKYADVDSILKYMAVHNFAVNEDSLSGSMAHNYYLYEANGRLSILPWDYNLAFGGMHGGQATSLVNEPIEDSYNATQFFDFVLENEAYKAKYHEYYSKLVNEYLYGGKFEETYNRIRSQIDELVKADPNAIYTYEEYVAGAEMFYKTVMLRAESVKGQLEGTIPSTSQGQQADSSKLVDASDINISVMGTFMGGGRGGFGGFGGRGEKTSEATEKAPNQPQGEETNQKPDGKNSFGRGGFGGRPGFGMQQEEEPAPKTIGQIARENVLSIVALALLLAAFVFVKLYRKK